MSNDCVCPSLDREIDRAVYGAWHEVDCPLYPADLRKAFEAGRASVLQGQQEQGKVLVERDLLRSLAEWAEWVSNTEPGDDHGDTQGIALENYFAANKILSARDV